MEKAYTYSAIFIPDPDSNGYVVEFPDWDDTPICGATDGRTEEEAEWMAQDLLGLFCEEMIRMKLPLPKKHVITKDLPRGAFIKDVTVDMDWYNGRAKPYRWRLLCKVWTQKIRRKKQ